MYEHLLPIIAPVIIATAVGFAWTKLALPFDREFMTRVIMNVGTPCLILQGISGLPTGDTDFLRMVGFAMLAHGGCAALGLIGLRLLHLPVRSYLPVVTFSNATNLGLPLSMFAFGQQGLGLGVGYVLVGSLGQFILVPLLQGRTSPWRTLVRTPVIYAAAFGVGLLLTGLQLPRWAINTAGLFGGLAIPLMLMALGEALAKIGVTDLRTAASLACSRLALGFALGWALTEAFGLTGPIRGVLLIESSMPVAVFTYVFAARYDRHPADAAGAVLVSTAASFLLMPALILFAVN